MPEPADWRRHSVLILLALLLIAAAGGALSAATQAAPTPGPSPRGDLTWTSDRDGALGAGEEVAVSTLSLGEHTITITATDSQGLNGTDQVRLTVTGYQAWIPQVVDP